jgi:hypothetical protein
VITGAKDAEVAAFKEEMKTTFQMSDLGHLSFYLGIEVHQGDSGITLRQTASWAHRLQPSSHSDGGEAEAESRHHDGGGGRYTVPTSCGEPSLPRPHTA